MTDAGVPFLLRDVRGDGGGPGLGDWFCVTVVRPTAGALDAAEVVRRLGGAPSDLRPWDDRGDLPWPEDVDGPVTLLLSHVDGAVVVVEPMGFQGIRHEVLEPLSAGAEVTTLHFGVNSDNLVHARGGKVLLHVDTVSPYLPEGEEPQALAGALDELVAAADAEDWDGLAAASVRALTGLGRVDLGPGWWAGPQQVAVLEQLPDAPPPPPTDRETLLAAALAAARSDPPGAGGRFVAALQSAVAAALEATGLAADPTIGAVYAEVLAAVERDAARGVRPVGRPARGRLDGIEERLRLAWNPPEHERLVHRGRGRPDAPPMEQDPLWQRFQAALATWSFLHWCDRLGEERAWPDADEVLTHVRLALADGWPPVLADLERRLVAVPG